MNKELDKKVGIASRQQCPGFTELLKSVTAHPKDVEFTISGLIPLTYNSLEAGEKIALSKVFNDSISNGLISGIKIKESGNSKKRYIRVGDISTEKYFFADYQGEIIKGVRYSEPSVSVLDYKKFEADVFKTYDTVIKCYTDTNTKYGSIRFVCEYIGSDSKIYHIDDYHMDPRIFEEDSYLGNDYYVYSIYALWHAYESLFNNELALSDTEVRKVAIIMQNPQMAERLGGWRTQVGNTQHPYNCIIQRLFYPYVARGCKELSINCELYSANEDCFRDLFKGQL